MLFRELIDTVENRDSEESKPVWIGYAFSVLLFVFGLLRTLFLQCAFNHMIVIGLSAKTSLVGAIYRKVLENYFKKLYILKFESAHNILVLSCQPRVTVT